MYPDWNGAEGDKTHNKNFGLYIDKREKKMTDTNTSRGKVETHH